MKRVLYIYRDMDLGGAQNQIVHLARILAGRGSYRIWVVSKGGPLVAELAKAGVRHATVDFRDRSLRSVLRCAASVARIIRTNGIDIVHAHAVTQALVAFLAVAKLRDSHANLGRRIPIITTVHSSWEDKRFLGRYDPSVWVTYRLLGICSTHIVAVSQGFERNLLSWGISSDKVSVIYHGIDLEEFVPGRGMPAADDHPTALQAAACPVVGSVGRLVKQKGFQWFLQAAAHVATVLPDTKFVIVGDGPMRDALSRQAKELGVADRVTLTGYCRDVTALVSQFAVFVSTSEWEGLPSALIEAMALEKPVVATDVKGNNEVVLHGQTGYLVKARNPQAIASAVVSLLRDGARARSMGVEGRRLVAGRFSLDKMAREIERLYESVGNAP